MAQLPTKLKQKSLTLLGGLSLFLGVLFIILPGPAIIFIPLGLALLSLEYPIAKKWLKKYQRYSKEAALKTDSMIRNLKKAR